MDKLVVGEKILHTRLGYVPRHSMYPVQQKQSIITDPLQDTAESLPSFLTHDQSVTKLPERKTNAIDHSKKLKMHRSSHHPASVTYSSEDLDSLKKVKDSNHGFKHWFNRLSPTQKMLLKGTIASLTLLTVAAATIVPVYFFVIRSNSPETTAAPTDIASTTTSFCSVTTCIGKETPYRSSIVTVLYPFDGNPNDLSGYASGTLYGTSTSTYGTGFVSGSIGLLPNSQQYVQIPSINFAQQSFTIQTWMFPTVVSVLPEYGIFSQCDIYNVCLSISIRNARVVFALDSMNASSTILTGTTALSVSIWYHLTVVYDISAHQQKIYINGRIDALATSSISPYRGIVTSSTSTTIGRGSSSANGLSYFQGKIDHFSVSLGTVRSTCQIYNDATLIAYYPFNINGTFNDYSSNLCNGLAFGIGTVTSGRINQAISFTSNYSYVQSQCFPKLRGSSDQAFSISLWIKPNSIGPGGTIVHLSALSNGTGTCYDMLALTASGNVVLQWITGSNAVSNIQGSVIPINTWTHLAYVFSSGNGARLYINGQISAVSPTIGTIYDNFPSNPTYLTLGNNTPLGPLGASCLNGTTPFVSGIFPGAIDNFRLYYRELDTGELCVLAHP